MRETDSDADGEFIERVDRIIERERDILDALGDET